MHVKNLILLAFISVSGAFTIPEGTEDGVYEHHVDANGLDIHVKLANATDYSAADLTAYSEARTVSRVMRAVDTDVKCGSGADKHDLHHGETDAANADLDRQCDTYGPVKPRHNYYAIRGNVVAFFCNFRDPWYPQGYSCSSGLRKETSEMITKQCGWYNAGWLEVPGVAVSYGYDAGRCFCGGCV